MGSSGQDVSFAELARHLSSDIDVLVEVDEVARRITGISDSIEGLTGQPPTEWVGRVPWELAHPTDGSRVERWWSSDTGSELDYRLATSNDVERRVWQRRLGNGGADRQRARVLLTDVTARDQALFAELAEYKAIAEHFPNGMVAVFDRDLRYRVINGDGLRQLGMEPERLQGQRLRDIFPPEVYERDEPALLAALRGERTESVVEFGGLWFRVLTVPVFAESGEVIAGLVLSQDISPLKRAETEARSTLEQLQLAVATAKLGIGRLDLATGQLEWNDEQLAIYGYTRDELAEAGDAWKERLHPEDASRALRALDAIARGETVHDVEFRVVRPDGEVRHVPRPARRSSTRLPMSLRCWGSTSTSPRCERRRRSGSASTNAIGRRNGSPPWGDSRVVWPTTSTTCCR